MSNPQDQGQSQERQPGESEKDYKERLQRTGAQGAGPQDSGEAAGPLDR